MERSTDSKMLPSDLLKIVISGILSGTLISIFSITYSSLTFFGELEAYSSAGIGFALLGAVILNFAYVRISSFPGMVALPQFEPALVLGIIGASIAQTLNLAGTPELIYPTMVMAIFIAGISLGIAFVLIGYFNFGNLVRFIPYPVIAGFMIGISWLMIKGAFTSMVGIPLSIENLPFLIESSQLSYWIPGVILASTLWLISLRYSHYLILPSLILLSISSFYVATFYLGFTLEDLYAGNWLVGPLSSGVMFTAPTLENFQNADWRLLFSLMPQFCVLLMITMVSLLLCASSLEVVVKSDIDLNSELKASGFGSFLCALSGGTPGYAAFSPSVLSYKMGAVTRWNGIITGFVCLFAMFYGSVTFALLPKSILGALLLYIGWDLLYSWTVDSWVKFTLPEKIIVALVTTAVVFIGFLEGISVGVLSGLFLFVVNYSQTDVVKFSLNGSTLHSHVDRSKDLRHYLQKHGASIFILKIQGYIFFGTANELYERLKTRVNSPEEELLQLMIIDFKSVTGIDSSAVLTFQKMALLAQNEDFLILFSDVPPETQEIFAKGGISTKHYPFIHFFPDLDYALESAENTILKVESSHKNPVAVSLQRELLQLFPNSPSVPVLLTYMTRMEFANKVQIITQNSTSNEMFFIESGEVSVELKTEKAKSVRLKKMGAGSVVGELTFYLGHRRTASVVTNEATVAYQLNKENLSLMKSKDPEASALLHEFIAHMLAERLVETDNLLKDLTD
jgi:sulfate permease, SulP family